MTKDKVDEQEQVAPDSASPSSPNAQHADGSFADYVGVRLSPHAADSVYVQIPADNPHDAPRVEQHLGIVEG